MLFIIWLLLNNSIAPFFAVTGAVLALGIPLVLRPLFDPRPCIKKPLIGCRYLLTVLGDITIANIQVAIRILGPIKRLRPGFVRVPLDLNHPLPVTILACTVSLTPGTVSAEVSFPGEGAKACGENPGGAGFLLIHSLDIEDEADLIHTIKNRYEAPLKEVFQC